MAEVAREEGIGLQTLYNLRNKAKQLGQPVPGNQPSAEKRSAQAKLATVIETASLNAAELSEYCREKGLYVEQVHAWKAASLQGFSSSQTQALEAKRQRQADRQQIKQLQRELREKEKALAETAGHLGAEKKAPCALGERARGRLTSLSQRIACVQLIQQATDSGARLALACREVGISLRTYRRWYRAGKVQADKRPDALRPVPAQ